MKLVSLESLQEQLKKGSTLLALIMIKEGEEVVLSPFLPENVKTFDAVNGCDEILTELNSLNLFEPEKTLLVTHAEKLKTADLNKINYPEKLTLIFIATATATHPLYKWIQDQGIIVDLTKENKFDKEKRLIAQIQKEALSCGKKIGTDVAQFLLQQVGTDSLQLNSEIQKLICFIGSEDTIKAEHIMQVTPNTHEDTIWQLMDALLKKNSSLSIQISKNLTQENGSFFSLIRQIRTQMQTEFQIASLLAYPNAEEEIQKRFPYMKGKILQQHIDHARSYGIDRFKRALITIDSIDLHSKNGVDDLELLMEILITKLSAK